MLRIIISALFLITTYHSYANVSETSTDASGDIAKLQYGWYPGISIEIKYKHTGTSNIPGQPQKDLNYYGNFLGRTVEHEEGLQIDTHEIFFHFNEGKESQSNNKMEKFMQELAGVSPSYIINSQGDLARVTKFEQFQNTIKEQMLIMFNDVPDQELEKIKQFTNAMFSKEQLMMQLHDDWNRDVGQWIGAELEQGYTYDVEFSRQIPMLGNISVPSKGTYEYLGRTACNKSDFDNKCVRLSYMSHVDEEATKPMMVELFKSMGIEDTSQLNDIGIKFDYSLEIITEENTLLPHYVKETKITSTPNPQVGGLIQKEEIDEFIYTYINR
jgi:hypothetical protein